MATFNLVYPPIVGSTVTNKESTGKKIKFRDLRIQCMHTNLTWCDVMSYWARPDY